MWQILAALEVVSCEEWGAGAARVITLTMFD